MIIGISGKINSGKDTVGEIIHYLLFRANKHEIGLDNSFEEFRKIINKDWNKEDITKETSFEIKKFADKLKDIVCILIGCTREQLEDREFKEKELGEDWIRYAYAIGHGTRDSEKIMWSQTCSKEKYEEEFNINWQTAYKNNLTPRLLLQLIGTECGRNTIHHDIWVNSLMSDYPKKPIIGNAYIEDEIDERLEEWNIDCPNWLVTDVRFPNEVKAIKDRNGIVIRINRGVPQLKEHISETALDNYNFDYTINNNGTIEDLIEKVKQILIKENIL